MKTSEFQKRMLDNLALISDQVSELAQLSDALLNRKENANRWSILECIEHLNRYNQYYIQELESNFSPTQYRVDRTLTSTCIGKKSIDMMSPLNRKKQKTFKKMDPVNSTLSRDVFKIFFDDQKRLKHLVEQLWQVNPSAKVVKVEFLKLLRMTLAETVEFLIVHEQRHILQAFDARKKSTDTPVIGSLVI